MDSIDQQILELLTRNARMDNRSIAKVVGTSDRTVARRIKKLEAQGVIHQYTLKLGHTFTTESTPADHHQVNASISEGESIRVSLTSFFGSGAAIILFHIGYGIGHNLGVKIRSTGLPLSSQLLAFTQVLEARGWGSLDISRFDRDTQSGRLVVVNSPFKGQRRHRGCDEVKGMITGFLETLFNANIYVAEAKCISQSAAYCEFTFRKGVAM
jgi:predicted hydrocarbon binding protein